MVAAAPADAAVSLDKPRPMKGILVAITVMN